MSLTRQPTWAGCLILLSTVGCSSLGVTTGPRLAGLRDLNENPHLRDQVVERKEGSACSTCGDVKGDCGCGSKRYTISWYEQRAGHSVGTRQQYRMGKLWPPYPRPVGPKAELSHRYHAAHYWPHPYVCQDRQSMREYADAHVKNGWMTGATLYNYHFDEQTDELTGPGRLHLEWIMRDVAKEHRVAWIQKTYSNETNERRIASVRAAAAGLVGEDGIPPIMLREATPIGTSADEIVNIRRAWIGSMPPPRITYTAAGAGG